ncbi:adenosylcobalamin-dependent ribonucleoside-diphosphate reductase [Flagellimonas aquimarina]|uniref:Vitamin B12-dependent ribonucleotide reductase n=1 Tax=Flagellimonas aquimarina TaxID=2201895 RepID=A0A316L658_9FLAO|nr:adenosylcobalamin-dependent ribonucleoside-diphosphate reductase [Allomuricauda koreensis]PWL40399.1 adenosylcobalamin-dependent ribonucleoside-diphosphate reductase [Allomuricauda koreensis]
MRLTKNATQILNARYLKKDINGKIVETPNALFRRVAKHISNIEEINRKEWENTFYKVMVNLEFLPNSPTLMNAGLPNGQLSACFVLPVKDSLNSIFTTLKNAALIHQSGGGTGYNFSKLRPKGDVVTSSGGTSSGPIAFMKIYDAATEYVKQGGKRRGANMGILNVEHPDIEDFIKSKSDNVSLRNFNISIGISDRFMRAVQLNNDWELINPRNHTVHKTVRASDIWQTIVEAAWKTGDPGLIFLDTINKANPIPKQGGIQTTNPCGEVPLLDHESCNLGSLNLIKMVKTLDGKWKVDWDKLEQTIATTIRLLDNVISANHYLLPQVKSKTTKNRKVGLGVMGWAEMLIMLGLPYASDEAVQLGEKLMAFIQSKSYDASNALAKERGTFPNWNESIYATEKRMRNATCNSIAPTGSISVIANTSYSIEPLYALAYKRVGILENETQMEINPVFLEKMGLLGLWTEELKFEVMKTGSIQQAKSVPKKIRKLFETSLEIPWKWHLLHQRAFQRYTDNAVSKTINLLEKTTKQEISKIYFTAWEYGLKGITIYRNGSKPNQVLQTCNLNKDDVC